jgi:maltose O-acetyltransferase
MLHPRLLLAQLFLSLLPLYVGSSLRAKILKLAGFQIGRGTVFWGMPTLVGADDIYRKLTIGQGCWIGVRAYFDLVDEIIIGDLTTLGPEVMLITGTHEIGDARRRVGRLVSQPVCTGNGVWLGARATILPGVMIGDGAVVGAGALVTKNVPPNTLVAGVPAVVRRYLDDSEHPAR